MADINIERKSGAGSMLPWIIGLLVLALLAWWLLAGRGDDDVEEVYSDTTVVVGAPVTEPGFDTTTAGAGLGYDTLGGAAPMTTTP
jgi:hypothetical protein